MPRMRFPTGLVLSFFIMLAISACGEKDMGSPVEKLLSNSLVGDPVAELDAMVDAVSDEVDEISVTAKKNKVSKSKLGMISKEKCEEIVDKIADRAEEIKAKIEERLKKIDERLAALDPEDPKNARRIKRLEKIKEKLESFDIDKLLEKIQAKCDELD